jgi:hypothetical protein
VTQPGTIQTETPLPALLEEALLLAHQLEATAAATREIACPAVQTALRARAAACVEEDGRRC